MCNREDDDDNDDKSVTRRASCQQTYDYTWNAASYAC